MKVISHKNIRKILTKNGFYMERSSKHQKWTNGKVSVWIPQESSKKDICVPMAQRLLKEAGITSLTG
jgi:predicted RNA binding protein YcfA (HicA-like mRNA interferase family)